MSDYTNGGNADEDESKAHGPSNRSRVILEEDEEEENFWDAAEKIYDNNQILALPPRPMIPEIILRGAARGYCHGKRLCAPSHQANMAPKSSKWDDKMNAALYQSIYEVLDPKFTQED
ncbi:Uu.00g140570.m01.CDS01 [Anthostomella pinea]|uniref:Uu.00g140570.m01.CDS01 n=1 Tax=Anthostomella pinea TaxID=933095 RepID=A0AAI8YJ00_9PEZI|nr:Uu.00g140570.m01.CDS01 [Anthostomella pinea]